MKNMLSPSHIISGLVSVLVGYTSSAVIVFQAAAAGGANAAEISSWLWALGIGMGVCGIVLSLHYKDPIVVAWSTPGAAILANSLPGIPIEEAIGAFLFSSILLTLCGITGWFKKIIMFIPPPIATAMLAGVLLRFGLNLITAIETEFILVLCMIFCYLLGKRFLPRYAIPLTFVLGIVLASFMGLIMNFNLEITLTKPIFITPLFSITSIISVGLPLFAVTMCSQNIPGIAVMRSHGYQTPASPLVGWTGFTGILLAPFGGFAFNLAAITAAICMGDDVDPDRKQRYIAAIWAGVFYILMGLFGSTVVVLFNAFPAEFIMAIAGLALMTTIGNSLKSALIEDHSREAAIITFLVSASGVSLWSIGGAFWGLFAGLSTYYLANKK